MRFLYYLLIIYQWSGGEGHTPSMPNLGSKSKSKIGVTRRNAEPGIDDVAASKIYDLELEGTFRLGQEMMDRLDFRRSMDKVAQNSRKKQLEVNKDVYKYFDQIIYAGATELKNLGNDIIRKFIVDVDFDNRLEKQIKTYKDKVRNHINVTVKQQAKKNYVSIVEKEFMYLDIIYFSNNVMQNFATKMLEHVQAVQIDNDKSEHLEPELRKLKNDIRQMTTHHMKELLDELCERMNICRFYPSFSTYFADLVSEILKLDDKKLSYILKFVKTKIERRYNFLKSFIKSNVLDKIVQQLDEKYQDPSMFYMKDFLNDVRNTITTRQRLPVSDDEDVRLHETAVRILIDVIDIAFAKERDDLTEITFDTTTKAIQAWKEGNREEIELPVKLFVDHVVNVLRQNWNLATRQEVMILTEVMILGMSLDDGFDDLLTNGSEMVQRGVQPVIQ